MKITKDLKAYSEGSILRAIYTILLNSNFHMIFWFRIAHFFGKIHLSIVSKIIMFLHKLTYSVDIDYRAEIGGGFKIIHGIAIVIGKDVVIEDNVAIYQCVTLGGNGDRKKCILGVDRTQPYIHSNVKLYSGCCILGPCEIGENSIVGAHTIITKDVEPNVIVHTVSQKVVTKTEQQQQE